jgi:hypothetical protein
MSHPYRPETDQVEKARHETLKRLQAESRLARAKPAKPQADFQTEQAVHKTLDAVFQTTPLRGG